MSTAKAPGIPARYVEAFTNQRKTETMAPEEFTTRMRQISEEMGDDPEIAHGAADDLICDLLGSLGYTDGVAEFKNLSKWYA